jgi:hypothetical protein
VLLLSDGVESGEVHQFDGAQSLAAAAEVSVPFYIVGLGSEVDEQYLQELAARTRGRYFNAAGAADLPNVYAAMEELLKSQLVVVLRSSAPVERQDRSIRISLADGDARSSAEIQYRSLRTPPAAQATVAPTALAAGPAAPAAVEAPGEKTATNTSAPAAALAFLVVCLAAVVLIRRRRRRSVPEPGGQIGEVGQIMPTPPRIARTSLTASVAVSRPDGSGDDVEVQLSVGEAPVTIGSAPSCAIRLPPDPAVAPEHARIGLGERRLMLHHLAPAYSTLVAGSPVTWASLGPGDEVGIGPYTVRCAGFSRGPQSEEDKVEIGS